MSIYATLWEIQLRKSHCFDTEWVCVYAQAVPPHIGHPSHYPEGDPYSDFLPPIVECDPETGLGPHYRAVVILVEGRDEKVVQRYTDPLMVLTEVEYSRIPFPALLEAIQDAIPWDKDVAGMWTDSTGQQKVVRLPGWRALENRDRPSDPKVE
jgi:hypothetical protein